MGGGAADKYIHKYRNIHEFIPSVQVIVEGHAVMIYKHMGKKLPDRKTTKTNNRNFVSFLFFYSGQFVFLVSVSASNKLFNKNCQFKVH